MMDNSDVVARATFDGMAGRDKGRLSSTWRTAENDASKGEMCKTMARLPHWRPVSTLIRRYHACFDTLWRARY